MITVESLYAQPKPEARALKRIRLLSLPFEIAFAGLALLQPAMFLPVAVFFFWGDGQAVRVWSGGALVSTDPAYWPAGSIAVRSLPLLSQVYAGLVMVALTGCGIAAFL